MTFPLVFHISVQYLLHFQHTNFQGLQRLIQLWFGDAGRRWFGYT